MINWSVYRYLYLSFSRGPDLEEWFTAWKCLAQLDGLHRLSIRIRNTHLLSNYDNSNEAFYRKGWDAWNENAQKMFEPVKQVKVLKSFVITLPHNNCSKDFDVGDSNCVFRHPLR